MDSHPILQTHGHSYIHGFLCGDKQIKWKEFYFWWNFLKLNVCLLTVHILSNPSLKIPYPFLRVSLSKDFTTSSNNPFKEFIGLAFGIFKEVGSFVWGGDWIHLWREVWWIMDQGVTQYFDSICISWILALLRRVVFLKSHYSESNITDVILKNCFT